MGNFTPTPSAPTPCKTSRTTIHKLNFCSGMPLRKVHELTFLWFGLPGRLLRIDSREPPRILLQKISFSIEIFESRSKFEISNFFDLWALNPITKKHYSRRQGKNFCSGMPLRRKIHELTFLWFGFAGATPEIHRKRIRSHPGKPNQKKGQFMNFSGGLRWAKSPIANR